MVSLDRVHTPTCMPSRAAANAASTPAWPAPITMTSNRVAFTVMCPGLLAHAEAREDVSEQRIARARSGHFLECGPRIGKVGENELLRERLGIGRRGVAPSYQARM